MRVMLRRIVFAIPLLAAFAMASERAPAAPVDPAVPEGNLPCEGDVWGPPGARMFLKFDPDRDGRVDLAGFVGHREARFRSLDADGDGRITVSEYLLAYPSETAESARARYGRFDADGDGAIDFAEWTAAETARFRRIDADGDGVVTREEFLADRARVCSGRDKPDAS